MTRPTCQVCNYEPFGVCDQLNRYGLCQTCEAGLPENPTPKQIADAKERHRVMSEVAA